MLILLGSSGVGCGGEVRTEIDRPGHSPTAAGASPAAGAGGATAATGSGGGDGDSGAAEGAGGARFQAACRDMADSWEAANIRCGCFRPDCTADLMFDLKCIDWRHADVSYFESCAVSFGDAPCEVVLGPALEWPADCKIAFFR